MLSLRWFARPRSFRITILVCIVLAATAYYVFLADALALDFGGFYARTATSATTEYLALRGPRADHWLRRVVGAFFDRIDHDIRPYWALNATELATRASSWPHRVRVRNGVATMEGDVAGKVPWLELWTKLVRPAAKWLPDLDMPINYMDESRLLVPFDEVTRLVAAADRSRRLAPVDAVRSTYHWPVLDDQNADAPPQPYMPDWAKSQLWEIARMGCPPDSPARNVSAITDFSAPPVFPENWRPSYAQDGYVKNMTAAADPCLQPHLRGLHGSFIEPISMSTSRELIPLFGGSKLPMNNEILIPAAMYLSTNSLYSGGWTHGPPWRSKRDGLIWRGMASGGRNRPETWPHFQRHRLVAMLNGTTVAAAEKQEQEQEQGREQASQEAGPAATTTTKPASPFLLAPLSLYDFPRRRAQALGAWLGRFADAGFTVLKCLGAASEETDVDCPYVAPYYRAVPHLSMRKQYAYKFTPDVDGNSYSGRFRGLLFSTSLPIKATIYAEWHDDRLAPWLHYAPMDNTFQDLYGVLDYFTRDSKGDAAARLLAETGKRWAETVLRREDMLLYTWRALLEFARVCDEDREVLGFVEDLL
ncbi:Lipopolysaccharide-modifying protein [Niveomyces insectorum RCEF 264]|uniref:Lipopolysaccharide-modifying protein n=1 Tax=Niveomyces insectorum RCEF 264 TaxID=1081102 RepID=A0A167SE40_9HYPO|nr:Lipopolysaccharide-modifying protein [Niveomyces insectorum RCEF 264]